MSKIIDITEKLSFDTSPVIKIKDIELKVNDDASTALKMMAVMSDTQNGEVGIKEIMAIYELVFDENNRKKIDALKLKFIDFAELVKTAMGLVTGNEELGE